jgi:hypothetical protein
MDRVSIFSNQSKQFLYFYPKYVRIVISEALPAADATTGPLNDTTTTTTTQTPAARSRRSLLDLDALRASVSAVGEDLSLSAVELDRVKRQCLECIAECLRNRRQPEAGGLSTAKTSPPSTMNGQMTNATFTTSTAAPPPTPQVTTTQTPQKAALTPEQREIQAIIGSKGVIYKNTTATVAAAPSG